MSECLIKKKAPGKVWGFKAEPVPAVLWDQYLCHTVDLCWSVKILFSKTIIKDASE